MLSFDDLFVVTTSLNKHEILTKVIIQANVLITDVQPRMTTSKNQMALTNTESTETLNKYLYMNMKWLFQLLSQFFFFISTN